MRRARLFGPFFIFAGVMHFEIPRTYESIVPDWLPGGRRAAVVASGIAEIAGGAAILHERTRRAGAHFSIATLLAVFPANLHMALHPERFPVSRTALYARLPIQLLFIAWARAAGRS